MTTADKKRDELAVAIVEELFQNHFGDKADRVALKAFTVSGERDLGGRDRSSARDAIKRVLRTVRFR